MTQNDTCVYTSQRADVSVSVKLCKVSNVQILPKSQESNLPILFEKLCRRHLTHQKQYIFEDSTLVDGKS